MDVETISIEPIQSASIPQVIAKRIIEMIHAGIWQPGDNLPPQRTLAKRLGVGVSSLREALQSLRAIGVLEIRHGEGTFVTSNPYQTIERMLSLNLALGNMESKTIFDARIVIEGGLAYLAAKNASDDQIEALFDNLEQLREAIETNNMKRADDLDVNFHRLIVEMADNEFMSQIWDSLLVPIEQLLRSIPHTPEGWSLHKKAALAIRSRHPINSAKAMREVVETTAARYEGFLKKDGLSGSSD
jgi:GntR family transcriptional repressor for pyruvate dehydrogenase complex